MKRKTNPVPKADPIQKGLNHFDILMNRISGLEQMLMVTRGTVSHWDQDNLAANVNETGRISGINKAPKNNSLNPMPQNVFDGFIFRLSSLASDLAVLTSAANYAANTVYGHTATPPLGADAPDSVPSTVMEAFVRLENRAQELREALARLDIK